MKIIKNSAEIRRRLVLFAVTAVLGGSFLIPTLVQADQFDAQINALKAENSTKQDNKYQLGAEATGLQDTISKLQAQINALQEQISANQTKRDDLARQITEAEVELAKQKDLLGQNIKQMYLEGQISTLEMLASSKDLSEYLDKQQYRDTVQDKIKTTLDKINALKAQLKDQKSETEALLKDQQNIQAQVASQQGEQSRILGLNQQQQSELDQQIKSNNASIADLRAQQAAANRRLSGGASVEAGDPGRGGYPAYLANAYQDSLIDPWGMYNRECVSYTAWKVYQTYGHMPYWGGHGNANQWPASAEADGIPTGSTPQAGAVAVSLSGYYGHVMWVEYVLPNGYIHVSQMNYDLAGHYSEMTINGAGLTYIYFQ